MSDRDVSSALDAMERMLQEETFSPEMFVEWQKTYTHALASADRGANWSAIMDRAHGLSQRMDKVIEALCLKRDALKKDLELQSVRSRALKGYKPF